MSEKTASSPPSGRAPRPGSRRSAARAMHAASGSHQRRRAVTVASLASLPRGCRSSPIILAGVWAGASAPGLRGIPRLPGTIPGFALGGGGRDAGGLRRHRQVDVRAVVDLARARNGERDAGKLELAAVDEVPGLPAREELLLELAQPGVAEQERAAAVEELHRAGGGRTAAVRLDAAEWRQAERHRGAAGVAEVGDQREHEEVADRLRLVVVAEEIVVADLRAVGGHDVREPPHLADGSSRDDQVARLQGRLIELAEGERALAAPAAGEPGIGDLAQAAEKRGIVGRAQDLGPVAHAREAVHRRAEMLGGGAGERERLHVDERLLADLQRLHAMARVEREERRRRLV